MTLKRQKPRTETFTTATLPWTIKTAKTGEKQEITNILLKKLCKCSQKQHQRE